MIFSSTFYRLCYYSWQTALAPPTPGLAIDDGHLWTSLPVPPEGPQRWALLRSDLDPPQGSARGLFCRPTLHPDPKALWVLVTSLPADSSGRAFPSTLPLATSTLTATPVRTHLQPRPTTTTRPPSRRRAQQDQSCPTPAPPHTSLVTLGHRFHQQGHHSVSRPRSKTGPRELACSVCLSYPKYDASPVHFSRLSTMRTALSTSETTKPSVPKCLPSPAASDSVTVPLTVSRIYGCPSRPAPAPRPPARCLAVNYGHRAL